MQDSPQRLEKALETWPLWNLALIGVPSVVGPVGGGLSNSSWLVEAGDHRCVLRLNNTDHHIWRIDRAAEYRIHRAVEAIGLAPEIIYCDLSAGFLVTRFIEGKVLGPRDLADSQMRKQLAVAIDQFSRLQISLPTFNYSSHLAHYVSMLRELGGEVPGILARAISGAQPEIDMFQDSGWSPSLVHHDLQSQNVILSDNGLKIIDWEYAAMGYAGMDLSVLGTIYEEPCPVVPLLQELIEDLWYLIEERVADANAVRGL